MPLMSSPSFKTTTDKTLELPRPASKGLNLNNLEYELDESQSPYMLNMMYRNGSFSKRYGQEISFTKSDNIHAMIEYRGKLVIHTGTSIYYGDTLLSSSLPDAKGLFVKFNQNLYYFCTNLYCYDGTTWSTPTPYVPVTVINLNPDGTNGDTSEDYNMIGTGFENRFHGDGSSTLFQLKDTNLDSGTSDVPKVTVDNEEWTHDETLATTHSFKVDYTLGQITLSEAAPTGTNNVQIIAYKHDDEWTGYHDQVMASKYYACFGGDNNSRLFVAGGGKSTYYYSDVYDATYFPYSNFARVGNSSDDITGFGQQYNILMVFKPTEIYSLSYYQQTSETTLSESEVGIGAFSSQIVNSSIGCDCPYSIQLINNLLVWYSTKVGICTLVSTNIVDERNVRVISHNIDKTNNFGIVGVKDIDLNENSTGIWDTVKSVDYDNKYFLVFPKRYEASGSTYAANDYGYAFVWDYELTPFTVTSSSITNAADLAWFYFDKFYVYDFVKYGTDLLYISSKDNKKAIKLNRVFYDYDINGDGNPDPINAYYMTPFLQFEAVEYLKTVKNIYIQCRGDTASTIDVYYYTDESNTPEEDSESIRIGGKMWGHFEWDTFEWFRVNWANVFRRKCSLKKIQMAAFFFKNNEVARDMSITHIALQYSIVKYIK